MNNNAPLSTLKNDEFLVIQSAANGDQEAFNTIYFRHKRRVTSLCLRMTANVADAEDLSQEVFLQLYRKLGAFRGDSAFTTWLYRLTVNVVLMKFRRKRVVPLSLDEIVADRDEGHSRHTTIGARDKSLDESLNRTILNHAINELPQGQRVIFVLHHLEGYEHNEIATIWGARSATRNPSFTKHV